MLCQLFFFYFSSLTCWVHFICAPTLERNEETSVCTKKKPKLKFNSLIFLHSFVRNTEFKTMLKICFLFCFFSLAILLEILEEFCCHMFLYVNSFTFHLSICRQIVLPILHIFLQNSYCKNRWFCLS